MKYLKRKRIRYAIILIGTLLILEICTLRLGIEWSRIFTDFHRSVSRFMDIYLPMDFSELSLSVMGNDYYFYRRCICRYDFCFFLCTVYFIQYLWQSCFKICGTCFSFFIQKHTGSCMGNHFDSLFMVW